MNKVFVVGLKEKFKKYEPEVKKKALKILDFLDQKGVLVEIFLVDANRSKILNQCFRKKNKPANVLSFEEPKGFIYPPEKRGQARRIGEVYLNLELTNNQLTDSKNKSFSVEQLLVHGLLHLFGYNHEKKIERIKMEQKEKKILEYLFKK